jgi:hypothetical protein
MTGGARPRASIKRAISASRAARARLDDLDTALGDALGAELEGAIEGRFKDVSPALQHRREHRAGVPSRLATDPELRAFVETRFATHTFDQIALDVAENFPPDRRVSRSSIHRWWVKTGKPTRGSDHL